MARLVIIIDGNNAMYRFAYAHSKLVDADGRHTGAVYGFLKCLLRLKAHHSDARFVVAWDSPGPTWRHALFSGYKAKRVKPPAPAPVVQAKVVRKAGRVGLRVAPEPTVQESLRLDVTTQIELLRPVLDTLSIPQMEAPMVEADDFASLLAHGCRRLRRKAAVYSGDKDFLQLLASGIGVIRDTDKKAGPRLETEQSVQRLFGCGSVDLLKLRALSGDKSDGIPGVCRGIGDVVALKLVQAGANPQLPLTKQKLQESALWTRVMPHWDVALRNYQLMCLPETITALPVTLQIEAARVLTAAYFNMEGPRTPDVKLLTAQLSSMSMAALLGERAGLLRLQRW